MWQKTGVVTYGGTVANIGGEHPLWLVTEAGIFGQDDSGAWLPLPQGQPLAQISALATAGQFLLAGNAAGQIVYSADGGQQWRQGRVSETGAAITCLALAPDFLQSGLAWAGTQGAGVLRSTDGGRSWQPANFGLQEFVVLTLATPPTWGRREVVFAATPESLYRSPNGGRAWKRADAGLNGAAVQAIAVSPNFETDRTVLAGTETHGLFRSVNQGKSWEPYNDGVGDDAGQLPAINALWVNPRGTDDPGWVAATGDGRLFYAANQNQAWQQTAALDTAVLSLGGDENLLWAGLYQQGLFYSADGGQSWMKNDKLAARNITRLHRAGSGMVAFGPLGHVWRTTPDGADWESLPVPNHARLLTLAAAPVETQSSLLAATSAGLMRWTAEQPGWQIVLADSTVLSLHFSPAFAVDQTVWAGTAAGSLLTSTDGGQNWRGQSGPKAGHPLIFLGSVGKMLVAATYLAAGEQVTLWRSADRGETWQQWQQVKTGWPAVYLADTGNQSLVCIDRRCWLSLETGWERTLETAQPIVGLAQSPAGDRLLLLTSRQVFFSDDGRRWVEWGEGLPNEPLLSAAWLPDGATVLTTGGVIWQQQI